MSAARMKNKNRSYCQHARKTATQLDGSHHGGTPRKTRNYSSNFIRYGKRDIVDLEAF